MIRILVIDFGCPNVPNLCNSLSFLGCLYIRRLPNDLDSLDFSTINGIILSGGPDSVTVNDHNTIDSHILDMKIPILGICYGAQLIIKLKFGTVLTHHDKLSGWKTLMIDTNSPLYRNLYHEIYVYCKHDDIITCVPDEFKITSYHCGKKVIMSFENEESKIYGVQYHPGVLDSKEGEIIIINFVSICRN